MAQYVTKWCPHCGEKYEVFSTPKKYYGSAIRTCSKCGKCYFDKDYFEMALDEPWEYKTRRISLSTLFFLIPLSIATIVCIALSVYEYAAIFGVGTIISVGLAISEIVHYKERLEWQENELRQSMERLSNPHYVMFLVKQGYYVPYSIKDDARRKIEELESSIEKQ